MKFLEIMFLILVINYANTIKADLISITTEQSSGIKPDYGQYSTSDSQ